MTSSQVCANPLLSKAFYNKGMKQFSSDLLKQPKLAHFIWEAFKRHKSWAISVLLLRCATMSTDILWPLFTKFAVDDLVHYQQTGQVDWNRMTMVMVVGFVAWFATDLPDVTARIMSGRVVASIRASVRTLLLHDMYQQSQQFFHDRFSGSISNSMKDLSEAVSDILNEIVSEFIPAFILVCCLIYVFLDMDPRYVWLMMAWAGVQVAVVLWTRTRSEDKSRSYANARSELFGKIIDSLSNHLAVRSFGTHKMEQEYISDSEKKVIQSRVSVVNYSQMIELVTAFAEVAAVFFGFFMIYMSLFQQGKATPGDFMFLIGAIWGVMKTVNRISERILWLYEQVGVAREAIAKIIVPHTIKDKEDANPLEFSKAMIEVKNIGFGYYSDRPVLQDVSFTVRNGERVGLVGYSGAGKTTLVQLLMRFYDPTMGSITIHGQDITQVTQESLRRNISLIPQDISLFHRTLRDNIRVARPDASDDEIVGAARLAGAHDFIQDLPNGYDTMVGERGIKLSGGQRQRIAIARAFLKAAPILILDEATSALDSVTEQEIQEALETVMIGRTTLVIAHRLSTLRRMDRILVFRQGRIVEDGTHEQLLAIKGGHYAHMWEMQAGGFLPENDPDVDLNTQKRKVDFVFEGV